MKSGWDKRKLTDWYICRQRWKRPEAEGRSKSGSNQRDLHETVFFRPSSCMSTKQSKEKGIALGEEKKETKTERTHRNRRRFEGIMWTTFLFGKRNVGGASVRLRGCATGDPSTITTTIVEFGIRKTQVSHQNRYNNLLKLTWSDQ